MQGYLMLILRSNLRIFSNRSLSRSRRGRVGRGGLRRGCCLILRLSRLSLLRYFSSLLSTRLGLSFLLDILSLGFELLFSRRDDFSILRLFSYCQRLTRYLCFIILLVIITFFMLFMVLSFWEGLLWIGYFSFRIRDRELAFEWVLNFSYLHSPY